MRVLFCFLFLSISGIVKSQDADMPDFRSKRESFSKMQEKDLQSDLAVFTLAGIDQSVGKLPLKSLPVTSYNENLIQFDNGNIKVIITAGAFDASKNKIQYSGKSVARINGKPYYGSYGTIPQKILQSVLAIVNEDTISIPSNAIADLFEPNFTYFNAGVKKTLNGVYISNDDQTIYIYMLSNDKAGGYEVTWIIKDKKYLRRVLDFGILK